MMPLMTGEAALDPDLLQRICLLAGARRATGGERLQRLWSGYGEIRRVYLEGASCGSLIVKRVLPPDAPAHSRGLPVGRSHARKLRSYDVEMAFYLGQSRRCAGICRVPQVIDAQRDAVSWTFLLEDLDAAGFPARRRTLSRVELEGCLTWLANFHAIFLGATAEGLWPVGTYWHLSTRPDELAVCEDERLRLAAGDLDRQLCACPFQTLVHGDAKVANFCFSSGGDAVAAVDFQYVGGGCGMKDVAYFFSSCLSERDCEREADDLLTWYFGALRLALKRCQPRVDPAAIEAAWRPLYPVAWADFCRFLSGWAPDHYKLHRYSRELTERALRNLNAP